MTTLHHFEGVLGKPLDTFFWALSISWSWLLAHVWSGPKCYASILRESHGLGRTNRPNKQEKGQENLAKGSNLFLTRLNESLEMSS